MAVSLPWPPAALSPNARVHWTVRSKAARAYRKACWAACRQAGWRSVAWDGPIHLWIDFFPPDRRHRDDDNLVAAFKSARDGIADALRIDDKRFRTHPCVRTETGGLVKVRLTPGPTQPEDSPCPSEPTC